MSLELLVETQQNVVTLTLNRPTVCNALNRELINLLTKQLLSIQLDSKIRVVVLQGAGDHFCAGADLKWMQDSINYTNSQNIDDAAALAKLMQALYNLSKPVICITQGAVYAGALGLVACCDVTIALASSEFCCSEVKLGIAPAVISPYVMKAMGAKAARRWLLTAEKFSPAIAMQLNLVQQIVNDQQELKAAVTRFANLFMQGGPEAIAATKHLLLSELPCNSVQTTETTTKLFAKLRTSAEGQEGMQAFTAKRAPNWLT